MKTKFIYFESDLREESVKDLITQLEAVREDCIELWFTSSGGDCIQSRFLVRVLNEINKNKPIKLVLTYVIESAAVDLISHFKGELVLDEQLDYIMIHSVDRPLHLSRGGKRFVKEMRKNTKELAKNSNKIFKHLLTHKEFKKLNKGEDIYLYKKDFKRIMKWRNKHLLSLNNINSVQL